MIVCKESGGTMNRTVLVTIRPTVTEVADAIWNLDSDEQLALLGCLKRRFCNNEQGLQQMALAARTLSTMPTEESDEVKDFVRCLVDYLFTETIK